MQSANHTTKPTFLQKVTEVILKNLENEQFGVEELSSQIGISRSQLHRKLKVLKGTSVSQFIREVRLQEAMKLLQQDVDTASEIAYKVGFSSPSYFYKCFQKYYGFPPGEVKKMKKDCESIRPIHPKIDSSRSQRKNKALFRWSFLTLLTILIISLVYYFQNSKPDPSTREKSIAVLPFKNLSNDEENKHFTDGLVDDLLGRLALIEEFEVISRTSSETFRDQEDKKIPEIAAELGTSYIVEGSVQKQNDKVRIIVQLIDAIEDDHIWVKTFDKDLSDVFEVQSEIAMQIASGLNMALSEEQVMNLQKNETENVKAMELYQLGRYHWSRRTKEGHSKALSYFQQAIVEDPEYALAYAGIAEIYYIGNYSNDSRKETENRRNAIEYANRALELNPLQVEAYTVLASVHSFRDCDWRKAEEEFKYGISLNSNHSTLYHRYSEHLMNTGRYEESRAAIDKAVTLDPLSFIVRTVSAENYYDNGLFEEAIKELQICQDLISGQFHWRINDLLIVTYYQLGRNEKLLKEYKLLKKNGLNENLDEAGIDSIYQIEGAEGLIKRYIDLNSPSFFKAVLYGLLGDKENCMQWLEKSQDLVPICAFHSLYEFRILHDDPRYIALLNQVGLPWKPEDQL